MDVRLFWDTDALFLIKPLIKLNLINNIKTEVKIVILNNNNTKV